jgi:MFS family permease
MLFCGRVALVPEGNGVTSAEQGERSGVGNRALVAAVLAHFTNDGNSIVFSVLIAYYIKLNISLAFLGSALAFSNLVSGFLSERIGFFADRSGRRGAMMAFGIALMGVAQLVFSASFFLSHDAMALLVPGVLILGIGLSFYHPLGSSIIAFATKGRSFSKQMGINGSFGSMGRAVFPSIVVGLLTFLGETMGTFTFGLILILVGVVIYVLSRSFDSLMVQEGRKPTSEKLSLKPYRRFILVMTSLFMMNAVFSSSITNYILPFYDSVYNSKSLAALIAGIIFLTPVIGQPVQGLVVGRIGGRRALYITITSSVVVFSVFLFSHNIVAQVSSLAALAFFVFTGFPVVIGYSSVVTPKEYITRVNAIIWGLGSTVGSSIGAALGGTLIQFYGYHTAFSIGWLFGMVAIAMLPLLPRKIEGSSVKL